MRNPFPCAHRTDLFVAEIGGGTPKHKAIYRRKIDECKTICATCPSAGLCLERELARMSAGVKSVGVFGGTTPEERKRMIGLSKFGRVVPMVHGTPSGYRKHRSEGSTPCVSCMAAIRHEERARKWSA